MITVNHLTKMYGNRCAISDLSFEVDKGEILGFLGPNGAGKSTTMRILTGYIAPTSGTAEIAGYDILDEPYEARRRIGVPSRDSAPLQRHDSQGLPRVCWRSKGPGAF